MVDTPTANLNLRKQSTGSNRGTWGVNLNQLFDKIDQVYEKTSITQASGTYTITREDFAEDTATPMVIEITSALTGDLTIVFPQMYRTYVVRNASSGAHDVLFTTGLSTAATIPQGATATLFVNGITTVLATPPVNDDGYLLDVVTAPDLTITGLLQAGDLSVDDDVDIGGDLLVTGASALNGGLTSTTGAFSGALTAASITVSGAVTGASLDISGNGAVDGNLGVGVDLAVIGDTYTDGLSVTGDGAVGGNFTVTGALTIGTLTTSAMSLNTLTVAGTSTLQNIDSSGSADFDGDLGATNITADADITAAGDVEGVNITGSGVVQGASVVATADPSTFAGIDNTDGILTDTLATTGAVTIGDTLGVLGDAVFAGKLTLSADPLTAYEAANKQYVDSLAVGIKWKEDVRVATTADITLSGEQTIDDISLTSGDRILVKDQTSSNENGIYVVAAGAWSRSTDADSDAELTSMAVFVNEGTDNGNESWLLSTPSPTIAGAKLYVKFASGDSTVAWSEEAW